MLRIFPRFNLFSRVKKTVVTGLFWGLVIFAAYYVFWGRHLYRITAYCNCPICVNVPEYQDGRFASGKKIYWGAVASDPSVRFGSHIELVPLWPSDWGAVLGILKGRTKFTVEDRGGMIKGKELDIFIPDSKGGHKQALKWGIRRMRIKINGTFAP